jgi:rhodanese-related sulfurtransferase
MKYFILLFTFCSLAFGAFREVDENELQAMIKKGVVVIDIRRDEEFKATGIIKGSHKLTFFDKKGNYDLPYWMNEFVKLVKAKETPFVIYCAHANRTKVVGNFLDSQMGYKEVYDLKGGINLGWIKKGLKTVRD